MARLLLFVLTSATIFFSSHGQGTNFIDQDSKLEGFAEPQWFKDNIPFIEVPDKEIEDVYYYRWASLKRHLRYTVPGVGYIVTEFVHKVFYSQKFDTINAAAGHHIYETRWLRNKRYVQDYINFWAREGGAAQQYSEWIADAAYATYLLDGDVEFIKSQQEGLQFNYNNWYDRFDPELNLFFISPHDDAQELSASSIQTDDPYRGGLGYRPSFNSEMYSNALAIAKIARLNNDLETAEDFEERADKLRDAILLRLWDDQRNFFYHVQRINNPNLELLDTREEVGFYPWGFKVPTLDSKFNNAWDYLLDENAFNSEYGPTTCEQDSQWYDGDQVSQCCWWNGNSWPYSTSFTLNSLASQIRNYNSSKLNSEHYVDALKKYAHTQYKNGVPYVAECHSPIGVHWVCDSFNHSEHYAHSTYTNNVLSELIGIQPVSENIFEVNPIVSSTWKYFLAENVAYHGHNITVLFDADGSHYQTTLSGLHVYVNGKLEAFQSTIGKLRVIIPPPIVDDHNGKGNKLENYATNVDVTAYPSPSASFTDRYASTWHAVDGRIFYDYVPNNRWSNFESPNEEDWFAVHFGPGRAKTVNQVKLYVYSDVVTGEGRVDCPKSMEVQILEDGIWRPADSQIAEPPLCSPNDVNTITFTPVKVEEIRVVFKRDVERDYYVGITELEIWAPYSANGVYEAEDGYIRNANILASPNASGNSFVGQIDEDDSSVEFTGIWFDESGEHKIDVYYANGGQSEATTDILVNNIHSEIIICPVTSKGWGNFDNETFVSFNVPLQRGNNNVIFRKWSGSIELDSIRIN